jgi:hypothetical protein
MEGRMPRHYDAANAAPQSTMEPGGGGSAIYPDGNGSSIRSENERTLQYRLSTAPSFAG